MTNSGIYGLLDPDDGTLRYIGSAVDFAKRFDQHVAPSKLRRPSRKNSWIVGLKQRGQAPVMQVLEDIELTGEHSTDKRLLGEAERFWIASLRVIGATIYNHTDGGDGGPMDQSVRDRIRESVLRLGDTKTADGRRRLSERHRGPGNRHAKLTWPQVIEIRSSTKSTSELAREYGVSRLSIYNVRSRRTWRLAND